MVYGWIAIVDGGVVLVTIDVWLVVDDELAGGGGKQSVIALSNGFDSPRVSKWGR